jgi:hypothetical protein
MAQKKETKNIKIRDLKPPKDAKGGGGVKPSDGTSPSRPSGGPSPSGWSNN